MTRKAETKIRRKGLTECKQIGYSWEVRAKHCSEAGEQEPSTPTESTQRIKFEDTKVVALPAVGP